MTTREIKDTLRSGPFTFPGGYPCYFITEDGAALSFEAVRENWRLVCDSVRHNSRDGWQVVTCQVNYEDPALYCEHTGKRIESAYAEDEAQPIA